MKLKTTPPPGPALTPPLTTGLQQPLLWSFTIFLNLLLTFGIALLIFPLWTKRAVDFASLHPLLAIRGLVASVLLFDIYTIYQQLQIRRMRRELGQGKELFRLIGENAVDMIAVVDAKGQRLYNSPAYEKVLGYTPEELKTTSSFQQIHPDDLETVREAARQVQNGGTPRSIEYRMRHKDGTWRFLESTASPVRNEKGEIEKLVIVNRDISERKQLEEKFRQAQKMEAVGRLTGAIAHDFNNLLGVMIGYAESIQRRLDKTHALRESADEIVNAGKRAGSLTQQLLAFSRQQVLHPTVLDLNLIVSDMEKLLGRVLGDDIKVMTGLLADSARVKADRSQLEQILMNLAVNARDAMPKGGKLILRTGNVLMDEAFVRQHPYPVQQGSYVLLTVTDTGTGMDAETKARAFQPFFTTKEKGKGTGLGLSTVYGVVKQSAGYIDVFSNPGEGTTFKIYLPLTDEAVAVERAHDESAAVPKKEYTILLAEDEPSLRAVTRSSLQECGYTVLEAKDGREALRVSRQYEGTIDLLLTDIVMPEIGGHALAQDLSRERPGIRIVYMSGYTASYTGLLLGMRKFFLMKPFTRDALLEKIGEALAEEAEVLSESK
jgi:two-component system, cell cycle sensor histidine kinase and response regulator CckA